MIEKMTMLVSNIQLNEMRVNCKLDEFIFLWTWFNFARISHDIKSQNLHKYVRKWNTKTTATSQSSSTTYLYHKTASKRTRATINCASRMCHLSPGANTGEKYLSSHGSQNSCFHKIRTLFAVCVVVITSEPSKKLNKQGEAILSFSLSKFNATNIYAIHSGFPFMPFRNDPVDTNPPGDML